MAYWRFQVVPCALGSCPQLMQGDGSLLPAVMLDDETGDFYVGGKNVSQTTWSGGGSSSGLQLVQPTPTANPKVWELPQTPKLLLLFIGGVLQLVGDGNDFTLNGAEITLANAPGPGANPQAVVGY